MTAMQCENDQIGQLQLRERLRRLEATQATTQRLRSGHQQLEKARNASQEIIAKGGDAFEVLMVLNDDADMVALLLRYGATTEFVDDDGDNLLQVAAVAERPSPAIVKHLLASGMSVDERALASAAVASCATHAVRSPSRLSL